MTTIEAPQILVDPGWESATAETFAAASVLNGLVRVAPGVTLEVIGEHGETLAKPSTDIEAARGLYGDAEYDERSVVAAAIADTLKRTEDGAYLEIDDASYALLARDTEYQKLVSRSQGHDKRKQPEAAGLARRRIALSGIAAVARQHQQAPVATPLGADSRSGGDA
jgi:hypothetical protein